MKTTTWFFLLLGCILPTTLFASNHCIETTGEGNSKDAVKWEFMLTTKVDLGQSTDTKFFFGEEASLLKEMIKSNYITREEVVPGDPTTRAVIRKPAIYQSVNSLEKYLKKEVTENRMSRQEATDNFLNIERVALAAVNTNDTKSFEDALSADKKSPTKLLSIFKQVKLISIY